MNNPLKFTCLFGGGAIRGLAYVGTLRALEELNVEFDIIAGSSVGSIFATLIACGYKSYELENLFMKVNFELFRDIHLGIGKGIALSKGEIFIDWLNELISKKLELPNKKNITFKDLNKNLVIITTDIKNFKPQEFSKEKTPDFEIAKAIKISSSMPGLMAPYKYNDGYLVDGDLQKASPMWRLSDTISNSESRILEYRLEGSCTENARNPISFINTIYSCVTDVATDFVTELYGKCDRYDYININTGNIFFADFNLNKTERRKLIDIGYEQTMKYFKEILPAKKENFEKIYTKINRYSINILKELKSNNVIEVQLIMGDLFMFLCENKEIIDPKIYKSIIDIKENILTSIKSFLFFHAKFRNKKALEILLEQLIQNLELKITEIKLCIQSLH